MFTVPVDAVTWATDSIVKKQLVPKVCLSFLVPQQLSRGSSALSKLFSTSMLRKHVISDAAEGAAVTKILLSPKSAIPPVFCKLFWKDVVCKCHGIIHEQQQQQQQKII